MSQHYIQIDSDSLAIVIESRQVDLYARVSATSMLVYDICQ